MFYFKNKVATMLTAVDVNINGSRPWDITVHNEKLYARVITRGSIGLGEAYMDGWWDCDNLDEFFYRLLKGGTHTAHKVPGQDFFHWASNTFFNKQSVRRAFDIGKKHYDIGNDLYEAMLDTRLTYTCGYWSGRHAAQTLEEAQVAKLDLICRKLQLQPGQTVLDLAAIQK